MMLGSSLCRSVVVALGLIAMATSLASDPERSRVASLNAVTANIEAQAADSAPATQSARENRPSAEPAANKRLSHFLLLGIVINVIVLALFGAWFVSQWRKSASRPGNRSPRP